jgi:hypothetical protein
LLPRAPEWWPSAMVTTSGPKEEPIIDQVGAHATDAGRASRAAPRTDSRLLATLVAAAGAVSAGFLLLDATLFWVLMLPATTASPGTLQALHALSYLAGGVALALPLGVLIGTVMEPSGVLVVFATLPLLWVAIASSLLALRQRDPLGRRDAANAERIWVPSTTS